MDRKELIARLISFDDEDTSTGFVDVSVTDKAEPIKTVAELEDYLYDFLRGKCSTTVYRDDDNEGVRYIDVCIGFPGAIYDYYIYADDVMSSPDKSLIDIFIRILGYIAGQKDLRSVAAECGGMRGYNTYTPRDDKYLSVIRNMCGKMYIDLLKRI